MYLDYLASGGSLYLITTPLNVFVSSVMRMLRIYQALSSDKNKPVRAPESPRLTPSLGTSGSPAFAPVSTPIHHQKVRTPDMEVQ